MGTHLFFFVGLALILTHEMDAIKRREWAILPLLARLDDRAGFTLFTILHGPLYLLLFWALYRPGGLNGPFIRGFDIFLMVHTILHIAFLGHPKNQFTTRLSWSLIGGAGLAGLLDLVIGF